MKGDREVATADLRAFEGLVHSTARMFAAQVKREEEDLAQELRIVVWRAVKAHDPGRSRLSLERFVFGAMTNKIRDYKRDAARERDRRDRNGVSFLHIEDMSLSTDDRHLAPQEAFDGRYNFVERDRIYGRIEGDLFALPAGVTDGEANVLVLLMMELSKPEIMLRLTLTRAALEVCITSLRGKFADWRPDTGQPDHQASERVSAAIAVQAEAELVGSRAA